MTRYYSTVISMVLDSLGSRKVVEKVVKLAFDL